MNIFLQVMGVELSSQVLQDQLVLHLLLKMNLYYGLMAVILFKLKIN